MVVVPTLLTTRAALEEQIERLEIHYLASPEGELYFALLSDWTDATSEIAAGDEALLALAAEAIARLNRVHGKGVAGERFRTAAPSPSLERGTEGVDGVGTQTREAARIESAAARRGRYGLP